MKYIVVWSSLAESRIDEIYEYYRVNADHHVAIKLIKKLVGSTNRLSKAPKMGTIEPLLINREVEYRFLVYKNYKIIYSVNHLETQVRIADVFDTRQNPIKIKVVE